LRQIPQAYTLLYERSAMITEERAVGFTVTILNTVGEVMALSAARRV